VPLVVQSDADFMTERTIDGLSVVLFVGL
jgi:hypothetical protein